MAISRFKHLLAGVICAVAINAASAADVPPPLTPTQEHRQWAAEQMINRLTETATKRISACDDLADFLPRTSEKCVQGVAALQPKMATVIREAAASGDDDRWAKVIDIAQKWEARTKANLRALEGR